MIHGTQGNRQSRTMIIWAIGGVRHIENCKSCIGVTFKPKSLLTGDLALRADSCIHAIMHHSFIQAGRWNRTTERAQWFFRKIVWFAKFRNTSQLIPRFLHVHPEIFNGLPPSRVLIRCGRLQLRFLKINPVIGFKPRGASFHGEIQSRAFLNRDDAPPISAIASHPTATDAALEIRQKPFLFWVNIVANFQSDFL